MSLQKRSSLSPSSTPTAALTTSELKQRVINSLNKLSDRDTHAIAVTELESIAKSLTNDTFTPFINCINATDPASKSPVRKQCVNLFTLLSNSHGNSLSPHLSKMVNAVTRRLRDPDTAIRAACVEAFSAMSSMITAAPFLTVSKPLIEMLTTEQDVNAQIGAAMCLTAAIEASPAPETEQLRKVLPRLGKLVRCEGFKAKAAVLCLIGSVVNVAGASGKSCASVLEWLVPCLLEFLGSEDWTARKAAADTLGRVAVVEKESSAREHRNACLSALESRRFDKVKVVRETMNRTFELWKEVPCASVEVSAASKSRSPSTDNNGCCPKSSLDMDRITPLPKKAFDPKRSPLDTKKQISSKSRDKASKTAMLDHKKHSSCEIQISVPKDRVKAEIIEQYGNCGFQSAEEDEYERLGEDTRRVLFSSGTGDTRQYKFGRLRSQSRVVPYPEDENCYDEDVVAGNPSHEEAYESPKDMEDMSLIRDQLLLIENQQSNLLEMLQKFMGSSQNGINSLETRVQGLEMVLDEISYDLAVSSGRIPNCDSVDNTCCKLPGAEFLSSKFWRRTDARYSGPQLSGGTVQSLRSVRNSSTKYGGTDTYSPISRRWLQQNRGEFMDNISRGNDSLLVLRGAGDTDF